jgi:ubiquinone/menaquinone biosynthesis C-methylase UbiE
VTAEREPGAPTHRAHYSYEHYADSGVAERFDALRFGGPIGRYIAETQQAHLLEVLAPLAGRRVLDLGTGTGRAALALARAGARVAGLDASMEMLRVAQARAASDGATIAFGRADAHAVPLADRSVDAVVCFRLLMHVVDWPRCLGEFCRVARWRVVIDFPAALSFAALESGARRLAHAAGRPVEAYRVMAEAEVRRAFASHGFRVVDVRRQFVLPIAAHRAVGRLALSTGVERSLAAVGLNRLLGSPVTMVAER